MTASPAQHEQSMACSRCSFVARTVLGIPAGLRDSPCIDCGQMTVWVTDPYPRPETPTSDIRARDLVERYLAASFKRGNRRAKGASQ